jgi:hypothetical protein
MRWVNFDRARIRTFISSRHRSDHRIPTLQCDAVVMAGGIFVAQLEGQNVTVHRAAANDIDLTIPRGPRLRVQRFVRHQGLTASLP